MAIKPFSKEADKDPRVDKLVESIDKINKAIEELRGINKFFSSSGQSSGLFTPLGFGHVQPNGSWTVTTGLPIHQPLSWSVTRTSAGSYTLNHNIGSLKYIIVVVPWTTQFSTSFQIQVNTLTNNSASYNSFAGNTPTDVPHYFIVFALT